MRLVYDDRFKEKAINSGLPGKPSTFNESNGGEFYSVTFSMVIRLNESVQSITIDLSGVLQESYIMGLRYAAPIRWIRKVIKRIGISFDRLEKKVAFLRPNNYLVSSFRGWEANEGLYFFDGLDITSSINVLNVESIKNTAEDILSHKFEILGSCNTQLEPFIDWHADLLAGHRWDPTVHYSLHKPAPYPGGYDIKVPWELSRCQHFIWLGQAYLLTGNEKYAKEFVAQVTDWIEKNPPMQGVNWACTMDVAIRAVNWLWGFLFFRDSSNLSDSFKLEFFESLLNHGRHIRRNLENLGKFRGNHYLSDIVGLVYLGYLLPDSKEVKRWREFGLKELETCMVEQVYSDGVDFEASSSYHRLVTELFLSTSILAIQSGHKFSCSFMASLEKMLEVILYLTRPDGTAPLIGDNDNGRLHRLTAWQESEREWVDFRYLLAIGSLLFDRDDFALAAGDQWQEAIWFWGEEAIGFKNKLAIKSGTNVPVPSKAFPDAGWYILRNGDTHMTVDAGGVGQRGNGGHAHNDTLSFTLFSVGQSWIVDPGTYVYTADYHARNQFRSTTYHNTVQVDDEEINPMSPKEPFMMRGDAAIKVHVWETTEKYDFLDAEHHGYIRLNDPVVHRRQYYFDKGSKFILIRDLFSGRGRHVFKSRLQIDPINVSQVSVEGVKAQLLGRHERKISITFDNRCESRLLVTDAWFSPSYGIKIPSKQLVLEWEKTLPCECSIIFILDPTKDVDMYKLLYSLPISLKG